MTGTFIVDAHAHLGWPGLFFLPETGSEQLLKIMDRLSIGRAVLAGDSVTLAEGAQAGISALRRAYEESQGRLWYLGVFDPRNPKESLTALKEAAAWPGFAGLKLHPSLHRTWADDPVYEQAWQFAAEHDLAILAHSWSISDYNPVQRYSTPERFEGYVRRFPQVRLVLGHAGGRGSGRHEAIRLVHAYPNVFLDFAGDIFCHRLIETLVASVPAERILFGSDFPWMDPRSNLTRVLLADVGQQVKMQILRLNARNVYRMRGNCADD